MLGLYIHRLSVDEVFVNVVHIGNLNGITLPSEHLANFRGVSDGTIQNLHNGDLFEVVNCFVVKVVKKKLGNGQIRAFYKIRLVLLIFRLVLYFLLVMRNTSDKGDLNLEV